MERWGSEWVAAANPVVAIGIIDTHSIKNIVWDIRPSFASVKVFRLKRVLPLGLNWYDQPETKLVKGEISYLGEHFRWLLSSFELFRNTDKNVFPLDEAKEIFRVFFNLSKHCTRYLNDCLWEAIYTVEKKVFLSQRIWSPILGISGRVVRFHI